MPERPEIDIDQIREMDRLKRAIFGDEADQSSGLIARVNDLQKEINTLKTWKAWVIGAGAAIGGIGTILVEGLKNGIKAH